MPIFAVLAILAFGDVTLGALFSGIALVLAAWITRPSRHNTKMIASIDRAVNDQDRGMPTLVGRVIAQDERGIETAMELAEFRLWTQDALIALADHQGAELPPVPEPVMPTEVVIPPASPPTTK